MAASVASKSKMLLLMFVKLETCKSKSLEKIYFNFDFSCLLLERKKNSNSKHLENLHMIFSKNLELKWLLTKTYVFPIKELVTLEQYMGH